MSEDTKTVLALLGFIVMILGLLCLAAVYDGILVIPGFENSPVYAQATAAANYRLSATQTATVNAPYTIEANGIRIERFTDRQTGNFIYICRQIHATDPNLDPVVPCQFQTNPGN